MTDAVLVPRHADIVCHAGSRPHRFVLASVTAVDPDAPFELEWTPGVKWLASDGGDRPFLIITCPTRGHGDALVDLVQLRRDMRSTRRRLAVNVLRHA